jgi:putative transposase
MFEALEGDVPVRIYVHASWTTFARLPLIDIEVAAFLRRFVQIEAGRHGARVIETGIVRDHVHMILELPPVFDVPRLMQGLKGASARIANRDRVARHESLRWAQGYDLRSVGVRQLRGAIAYVRSQADRHPEQARDHASLRTPPGPSRGFQPTETTGQDPHSDPSPEGAARPDGSS